MNKRDKSGRGHRYGTITSSRSPELSHPIVFCPRRSYGTLMGRRETEDGVVMALPAALPGRARPLQCCARSASCRIAVNGLTPRRALRGRCIFRHARLVIIMARIYNNHKMWSGRSSIGLHYIHAFFGVLSEASSSFVCLGAVH